MFLLIMNGLDRYPHVEEVETLDDVQARLEIEDNPNDILVVKGEVITHQREEFLFLNDKTIKINKSDEPSSSGGLPSWIQSFREGRSDAGGQPEPGEAPAPAREAEHTPAVEGHAEGEAHEAPGDSDGEGSEPGRDGEDSGISTDDEGGSK